MVQDPLNIEEIMTKTTNTTDFTFFDDHQKVLLLKFLIDPVMSSGEKNQRKRHKPTSIKVLYHLFQLNKNIVIHQRWTKIAPGKKSLSRGSLCSIKAITKFINGDGQVFFKKISRPGATNIYELDDWVIEVFKFFEAKGMMKGFREDYKKWRVGFLKRLSFFLLPLLEKGHCLKAILTNKLSTKSNLKMPYSKDTKGPRINPSGLHEAFQGSKSNSDATIPVFDSLNKLRKEMNRRGLQDGDVNQFLSRYSPSHNIRAMGTMCLWARRGMDMKSAARVYQTCINVTRL